jgi:hypothetical protein
VRTISGGERTAIAAATVAHVPKVEIQDADGAWQDWSSRCVFLAWGVERDSPVGTASLSIHRGKGTGSLAPTIEASTLNRDSVNAYAPAIDIGRGVRISTTVGPDGLREQFIGRVDSVDWESDPIRVECSDLGAWLMDTQIQEVAEYGDEDGETVESIIQAIIDATPSGVISPTLYVPDSPLAYRTTFEQQPAKVLEAAREVALGFGWDLRYRHDASHVSRLTLIDPGRDSTAIDAVIGPGEYHAVSRVGLNLADLRNAGRLYYLDNDGIEQFVDFEDEVSIAKYGRRWFQIPPQDGIHTETEAQRLIDAIGHDLSGPGAELSIELLYFWPVQLYDRYTIQADGIRFDTDQVIAVSAYRHEWAGGGIVTTITGAARVVGAYAEWRRRVRQEPPGPVMADVSMPLAPRVYDGGLLDATAGGIIAGTEDWYGMAVNAAVLPSEIEFQVQTETAAGSGAFGGWVRVDDSAWYRSLVDPPAPEAGFGRNLIGYDRVVDNDGRMRMFRARHLIVAGAGWKSPSEWTQPLGVVPGAFVPLPPNVPSADTFVSYPLRAGEVEVVNRVHPYGDVHRHGAIGDGVADDTAAIQVAIDSISAVIGGTVTLGLGMYRTTAPLVIPGPNIRIVGPGRRNIQSPISTTPTAAVPATFYKDHAGDLFTLPFTLPVNGFNVDGITCLGNGVGRAFGFDLGGASDFRRDFRFTDVAIQGFAEAFGLYESSPETGSAYGSAGVIRIVRSAIMHNKWIARTATGKHWNAFHFTQNEAGQNGYGSGDGGISIEAHNANISDNVMEGERDPIILRGGYTGVTVKNNYFEANVGDACIQVIGSRGPMDIGENLYYAVSTTHKVVLYDTLRGDVRDPYWARDCAKVSLPVIAGISDADRNLNTGASAGVMLRVDSPSADFLRRPDLKAVAYSAQDRFQRVVSPFTGRVMWTFGETQNAHTRNYTIAASSGDWLVMCVAFRRRAGTGDPYINFGINGTTVLDEGPCYTYRHAVDLGEWAVITKAVRATAAVTAVNIIFYVNGFGGSSVDHDIIYPVVYAVDDVNKVRPYFDADWSERVPSAPTNGTWVAGDRVHAVAPAAGGFEGWICTTGGTPGTWKTFGAISA